MEANRQFTSFSASLDFRASVSKLYNGHYSLYIALGLGNTHLWIQRWDTARVTPFKPRALTLWYGRTMTWQVGSFNTKAATLKAGVR